MSKVELVIEDAPQDADSDKRGTVEMEVYIDGVTLDDFLQRHGSEALPHTAALNLADKLIGYVNEHCNAADEASE